jgi:hypothetical protein
MKKKILISDQFIMNDISYKDLISLYEMKISKNKIIKSDQKKSIINHPIGISINDISFKSICEGLFHFGIFKEDHNKIDKKSIQYREESSIWNKINKEIKKENEYKFSWEGKELIFRKN